MLALRIRPAPRHGEEHPWGHEGFGDQGVHRKSSRLHFGMRTSEKPRKDWNSLKTGFGLEVKTERVAKREKKTRGKNSVPVNL